MIMKNVLFLFGGGLAMLVFSMCAVEDSVVESDMTDDSYALFEQILREDYGATLSRLSSDQLESRTTPCTGLSNNGGCSPLATLSLTLNIDGCDFAVTADYQICIQPGNVVSLSIFNLLWTPNTSDACEVLFVAIDGLPTQSAKQAALDDVHANLSLQIEQLLAQVTITAFLNIPCGGLNSNLTTSFFETDCRAWCLVGSDLGGGGFQLSYVNCGASCCMRSSQYCINPNGEVVLVTSAIKYIDGECTAPSSDCLVDVDLSCSDPCARLN